MQLKYSNYVAFSHFHSKTMNNSGLKLLFLFAQMIKKPAAILSIQEHCRLFSCLFSF